MKQYFLLRWDILPSDKHSQPGIANRPLCSNVPHIKSKKNDSIQLTLLHFLSMVSNASAQLSSESMKEC